MRLAFTVQHAQVTSGRCAQSLALKWELVSANLEQADTNQSTKRTEKGPKPPKHLSQVRPYGSQDPLSRLHQIQLNLPPRIVVSLLAGCKSVEGMTDSQLS